MSEVVSGPNLVLAIYRFFTNLMKGIGHLWTFLTTNISLGFNIPLIQVDSGFFSALLTPINLFINGINSMFGFMDFTIIDLGVPALITLFGLYLLKTFTPLL